MFLKHGTKGKLTMYERHKYSDIKFPIKFHRNHIYAKGSPDIPLVLSKKDIINSGRAHWHEGLEILRMVDGTGNVHINTDVIKASAGDIIVIGSNKLHCVSVSEGKCALDCLIINYGICIDWGFDPCEISYETHFTDNEISFLFDRISQDFADKKPFYKSIILAHCLEIMALISRNHVCEDVVTDAAATKKANLTRQVMQYIARNIGEKITLKSIGDELKYSHFYLEHIFSELTGLSIREYLTETRIREAEKLLLSSDLPISEISEKCGYSNAAAFSTAFKKKCGISPMKFRNSERE